MAPFSTDLTPSPESGVLAFVLDAYKQGCVDRADAIGMLKQIIAAGVIGDSHEIRELSKTTKLERWAMSRGPLGRIQALPAGIGIQ